MAGAITENAVPESFNNSFDPHGFRSLMSQDPQSAHGTSTMGHEARSRSDSLVGPITQPRSPKLPSETPDRFSQSRSDFTSGRQASRRSSLPVTSIDHLVSSDPPINKIDTVDTTPRYAQCTTCDEWILIQHGDGRVTNNWAEHSSHCKAIRSTRDRSPSVVEDNRTSISETRASTADSSEPKDTNTAFRRRKVKHYESERLALLERDPQIEDIEEYRVLCAFCEKWIQLRKDRPYCPIAWTAHKLQCVSRRRKPGPKPSPIAKKVKRELPGASLSSVGLHPGGFHIRRTEEERVKFLKSDPHATSVEPHRILCAICGRWIQLRKNSTYCTAPWVQHVRKCAARHSTSRNMNGSGSVPYVPDMDGEDELDSDDSPRRPEENHEESPQKRGRGRPPKRKVGLSKSGQSFALRPVDGGSPSPSNHNLRENGRSSVSPVSPHTPSPPLNHPYSNDMYWYPALPPMSSYYPLYAGSQYNEQDDSYSLYFHAQPPVHQLGPTPGKGRTRAKPLKQTFLPVGKAASPATGWPGPLPMTLPSGSNFVPSTSPGPDASSSQPCRAWIVWRLKNYSTNTCPMDPSPPPDVHPSSAQRAGSEVSGSGSDALPMFRSGTWPHLMDPHEPDHLSPYVHPEAAGGSKDTATSPSAPSATRSHFGPPVPPAEDSGLINFNSSAHIPIRTGERSQGHSHTHPHQHQHPHPHPHPHQHPHPPPRMHPQQLPPISAAPPPPMSHPEPSKAAADPRFPTESHHVVPVMPEPPNGADLDSSECRLAYTFQSIAYLFRTSYQGADDMSLDTLTSFMNRSMPRDKMYTGQEVSRHVANLGERKQLVCTKEGGVQLLGPPS